MFANKQVVCFKVSHLAYKVRLMPLDSTSYKKQDDLPEEKKEEESEQEEEEEMEPEPQPVVASPSPPAETPLEKEKEEEVAGDDAVDEDLEGQNVGQEEPKVPMIKFAEFRALPKLNLVRVFAFVQQRVFLQEPISTCFSFLLDWSDTSNHEDVNEEEWTTESGCDLAAEMDGAPSLNQGAEVIPCHSMFRNLTRQLHIKNLICLCEVDTDFFGLIDCITLQPQQNIQNESDDEPVTPNTTKKCYLRLQVFQKHDKIPWQTDISTMLFTLIEQRSIKNSLFSIQKYMEILPTFNEPFVISQREAWANQLASALIQIRVQGKQSECRKKVLTALDIAQVLYDQQFVAYLKKTFLDDNGNNNNQNACTTSSNAGGGATTIACGTPSGNSAMAASSPVASMQDGQRPNIQREPSFQKSFTPRQNFGSLQFTRQQPFPPAHGSPSGQTNSGKSSMQKNQQPFHNFQDRPKRPFFHPPGGQGNAPPNNNDSSSTYSHNTNISTQKPPQSQQFQSSTIPGVGFVNKQARGGIKRNTYPDRQKLEGAQTGNPSAPPQPPMSGGPPGQQQSQQPYKRFKQ